MIQKPIDTISIKDIQALVERQEAESRTLEYKRDLPSNSDEDKKEFLADISALANSYGGDLIFGIEESDDGTLTLPGIKCKNVDTEQLRLESITRDGFEPRLSGVKFKYIPITDEQYALVLRVPASLAAPHRIKFRNSGKFFSRNSKGKYEMDTHELRDAFTSSEQVPARIRKLHADAVQNAKGHEMPFTMIPCPTVVVSIIPQGFFRERRDLHLIDSNSVRYVKETRDLTAYRSLQMLEGHVSHDNILDNPQAKYYFTNPLPNDKRFIDAFALTHRSGRVDAAWLIGQSDNVNWSPKFSVLTKYFEAGIKKIISSSVTVLCDHGIEGPWIIIVTVFGIDSHHIPLDNSGHSKATAWRDEVILPELILDDLNDESLLPLFKSFWRLFGATRPD